jgi:hypothetical protein
MTSTDAGWPHTGGRVPVSVRGIAGLFPYRATLPKAPAGRALAGTRLAVTEASDPALMWVWARTEADIEASRPNLQKLGTIPAFTRHDGTGQS